MTESSQINGKIRMRLTYADVDRVQFFFANYYHWMDRGLAELLANAGLDRSKAYDQGFGFPVVESGCKYLARALVDQHLTVTTTFQSMSQRSFRLGHIFRHDDGSIAAEGFTQHVCVNVHEMKPREVPDAYRAAFAAGNAQEPM